MSCSTPLSVGFGKACKISIEGYCIGARNAQALSRVLSVSKNRYVFLSLWKFICCLHCVLSPLHVFIKKEQQRDIPVMFMKFW